MFRPLTTGKSIESSDEVYVDLELYNHSGRPILQKFTRNYDVPIVEKARLYKLSVVRFLIDASLFPIRIVETTKQNDVNEMKESITLEYNGEKQTVNLEWVPQESDAPVPSQLNPQDIRTTYYYMYDFQHYLNILNTALSTAFQNLSTTPQGATPPFFRLNMSRKTFELVADLDYYDEFQVQNPIFVYANEYLANLLDGFSFIYGDVNAPDYARFIIQDTSNNKEDDNLVMTSLNSVLSNFNMLKSLIITSNLLPCQAEFISTNGQFNQDISAGTGNQNEQLSVITDFIVPDDFITEPRRYEYLPTAQYRYVSMLSDSKIQNIDLSIYARGEYGEIYPLYLRSGRFSSVKLLFQKI